MYDPHWSDEQIVSRLYGVGPEDGHLEVCPSCAARWEAVRRRYESRHAAPIEVAAELLAAQRSAIRARIDQKKPVFPRLLVPVLATLLLAVIIIAYRPAPAPPPAIDEISDAQLFEDVFSRVADTEPSAIGPIRSLFEVQK